MSADRTRAPVRSLAVALEGGQAGAVVSSVNGTSGAPSFASTQPSGGRLEDIRGNLTARIAEAEGEGWAGEAEGLKISLDGTRQKLAQLARRAATVHLGMPGPADTAGRILTAPSRPGPPAEPS